MDIGPSGGRSPSGGSSPSGRYRILEQVGDGLLVGDIGYWTKWGILDQVGDIGPSGKFHVETIPYKKATHFTGNRYSKALFPIIIVKQNYMNPKLCNETNQSVALYV